jgi:hypothetical protein
MPVTKTYTVTLFTFDELSDKAKEVARAWWHRCEEESADNYWSESVIDDAVEIASRMGIEIKTHLVKLMGGATRPAPSIWWSGFSSQGDGSCFDAEWRASGVNHGGVKKYAPCDTKLHDIAEVFERLALAEPEDIFTVRHIGPYSHSGCTDFYCDIEGEGEEELVSATRAFMDWIYEQLRKEYEYTMADEQVDESLRINEYTFLENGMRAD